MLKKLRRPAGPRSHPRASVSNGGVPVVSVIIPVLNEARTLPRVIREAYRVHPRTEVIVVANGTTDGSQTVAARLGARVLYYDRALGHDVGRSIGAAEAQGSILLFVDGDFMVSAAELRPLVQAVAAGVDVALNRYNGLTSIAKVHRVVLAKHAMNAIVEREDLLGASMTTIPHAISRRALEAIGAEQLAVPPLAQMIAIRSGLKVQAVKLVPVRARNPVRRVRKGADPIGDLIIGDHLEAIHWLIRSSNGRGGLADELRLKERVR